MCKLTICIGVFSSFHGLVVIEVDRISYIEFVVVFSTCINGYDELVVMSGESGTAR